MANFYVTSTGETTISTIVDGLSTTHGRVREFNWYANNVFKGKSFTEPYTGSKVHTFTSLSPNTFYNLKVVIIDTKVPP